MLGTWHREIILDGIASFTVLIRTCTNKIMMPENGIEDYERWRSQTEFVCLYLLVCNLCNQPRGELGLERGSVEYYAFAVFMEKGG